MTGGTRAVSVVRRAVPGTKGRLWTGLASGRRDPEADGKSWREAIRALKRQLVRPVFRLPVEGSGVQLAAA